MDKATVLRAVVNLPRLEEIAGEPYEPRGIFNSEMAFVLGIANELKIERLIESGRARGQSTYVLAKYLAPRGVEIHSFELRRDDDAIFSERRLDGMPGISLHYGDAHVGIPTLINVNPNPRTAILLDGPKGPAALRLMAGCVAASDNVVVGFIHDMRRVDGGRPAESRKEAERLFPNAIFSDDTDYVEATSWLDAPVWAIGERSLWSPHHMRNENVGSYGPTIGAFVFDEEDRRRCRASRRVTTGARLSRVLAKLAGRF